MENQVGEVVRLIKLIKWGVVPLFWFSFLSFILQALVGIYLEGPMNSQCCGFKKFDPEVHYREDLDKYRESLDKSSFCLLYLQVTDEPIQSCFYTLYPISLSLTGWVRWSALLVDSIMSAVVLGLLPITPCCFCLGVVLPGNMGFPAGIMGFPGSAPLLLCLGRISTKKEAKPNKQVAS